MTKVKQFWMVKQEPSAYSWDDFVRDGGTTWTGVRNYQARNHLRTMQRGDRVLFYHSVTGKAVVGVAEVTCEAYPDPTASDGEWFSVDLAPVEPLRRAVSLEEIKAAPGLKDIALLRQSRLSVLPLKPEEYQSILQMADKK